MVKEATSEQDFAEFVSANASKPIVVDFTATWCGPCQRIAPFFAQMATTYGNSCAFIKVDVDKLKAVAQQFKVTSMPTFVFLLNGSEVTRFSGASTDQLENTIKGVISGTGAGSSKKEEVPEAVAGRSGVVGPINAVFDNAQMECLNEDSDFSFKQFMAAQNDGRQGLLKSDCDEQLLITVPFANPVRVHSILVEGPANSAPSSIKLYTNQTGFDFDNTDTTPPVQALEFTPKHTQSGAGVAVELKFVKFQNVHKLTLFVDRNHGDQDVTVISKLVVIGNVIKHTATKLDPSQTPNNTRVSASDVKDQYK